MMTHYKNIVFDLGNVLLTYDPLNFMQTLLGNDETGRACFQLVVESQEWKDMDSGHLAVDDAKRIFVERDPSLTDGVHTFFRNWLDLFQPITETVGILKELKANGYRLFVLSNFIRESFEAIQPRFDFFNCFDGLVISYRIGVSKPDWRIYDYLLTTHHLLPQETLFIDDLETNTKGAEKAGIATICYQSPRQLRDELSRIHII